MSEAPRTCCRDASNVYVSLKSRFQGMPKPPPPGLVRRQRLTPVRLSTAECFAPDFWTKKALENQCAARALGLVFASADAERLASYANCVYVYCVVWRRG